MSKTFIASTIRKASFGVLLMVLCAAGIASGEDQEGEPFGGDAWPRVMDAPSGRVTIYEPELESLRGSHLVARAAVSAVPTGASEPLFGGLWLDADLKTDTARKIATFLNARISEIRFPSLDSRDAGVWREAIASEFLKWDLRFSMDRLLENLRVLEARNAAAQQIKAEVPRIIFRTHASALLAIDGEPAWRDLPGTVYRRLVNTSYFIVQENPARLCYLSIDPYWWVASSPAGPWQPIDQVPAEVADLLRSEPKPQGPAVPAGGVPPRPEIVQAEAPTELIWTDGPPDYAPIRGTDLLYVRNTESDVFLDISSQLTYALLSGRWFRSADRVAWEFVPSDQLPLDFGRIPPSSEKHHVLACVAGTSQARDAVRNAAIPLTSAVAPGAASNLWVTYDGEPRFTDVPDSPVRYAVNSPYAVLDVNNRYYCCDDGVWYDSENPWGPWLTSVWVPSVIYLLPPSCPYYYVTHCRIYGYTDWAVYVGYDPGYLGCYAWCGTPVYGTGWNYSCWSGHVWCPRPATWGVGVRYNSRCATWTVKWGGTATCAWTGLHRPAVGRGNSVSVGVAGAPVASAVRRGDVHGPAPRPTGAPLAAPNLYARHPERTAAPRPLPAERASRGSSAGPVTAGPEQHPAAQHDRRGAADVPAAPEARTLPPAPSAAHEPPPVAREHPRTPPPASARDLPEEVPSPAARELGERPKAPPQAPSTRENPEGAKKTPPSSERRDLPRYLPPPAPVEHHEPPRYLPPPSPVEQHREPPRYMPPPTPVERREPPRTPPPQEHREPPRTPPAEHREAPRNPPPAPSSQNDRRDSSQDRTPGRR